MVYLIGYIFVILLNQINAIKGAFYTSPPPRKLPYWIFVDNGNFLLLFSIFPSFFLFLCFQKYKKSKMTINVNIKSSSDKKFVIAIDTDKTVLDLKNAIAEQTEVPAERQRLIYSGRVLKDPDTLADCKVADGNTIHMVKGGGPKGKAYIGCSIVTIFKKKINF